MPLEHRYGGPWTQVKLEALRKYLGFYTSALRHKGFELWYVDAFAGTGHRTVARELGMFDLDEDRSGDQQLDGSARIALATDPPFQRLVFIEQNRRRFSALEKLPSEYRDRDVVLYRDDANERLPQIASEIRARQKIRAIVFVDPYGMTLRWDVLMSLRDTRQADILYLFPLGAVVRQAALDLRKVDPSKEAAITRIYGTDQWREEFYSPTGHEDLFGAPPRHIRRASPNQIDEGFRTRLRREFPYVSPPLPLLTRSGAQLFSLFLAVSNKSKAAIALAKKPVYSIFRAAP